MRKHTRLVNSLKRKHDGYPVKTSWETFASSKDGISELTLYCPIKRDPVTGEIIYKKKSDGGSDGEKTV